MTTVLLLTTHLLLAQAVAPIDAEDVDKLTQLMRASARGDVALVEGLLAKGADPNARSSSQNLTALMFAAYHGHEAVVKALLGKGARIDLKDSLGAAAVDWAAFAGHTGLERLLTGRGAALNPFLNVGTLPVGTMEKAAAPPK